MAAKSKILFIEDEPDQIMMVRLRLEKSGFEVVTAGDGKTGIKKAREEKPDLILLDIVMPGMDGFEVCRRLRGDAATKRIPVIVATAAGIDDLEHICVTAGADDCIRKPYDSQDLLKRINALLKN